MKELTVILLVCIVLLALSYLIVPPMKNRKEKPKPGFTAYEDGQDVSGEDWELKKPVELKPIPEPYASEHVSVLGEMNQTRQLHEIREELGWYGAYREYVGLTHEEIRQEFPNAPFLEQYRQEYEQRKAE